ncbi:olfactory receptor 1L4-like [Lepisosteus oculatus]|uniref:olfactory receptor 1L4-like n=1 Tax=Lepisosteus oculatus TaxID=7918 RepID=UPI0003EA9A48|nr:PREDICTED: olfactory receptor 1L4-like [Lepisosteus oculatus]
MSTDSASRATFINDSFVRPQGFYLAGFSSLPLVNVYLIFLSVVYIVTLLSNTLIVSVIWSEERLHTPKYIAVVNLAVTDICYSTTLIPQMIRAFLLKYNFVPYSLCLTQMFFAFTFASLESFSLAILAYDRLIAICFPLRQHYFNTVPKMTCIVFTAWIVCTVAIAYSVSLMNNLSFCKSTTIYSYFCDYAPVFRLACNDYTQQWVTAVVLSMLIIFVPLMFIICSYLSILTAVFKMQNLAGRHKALVTCTEHLTLVALFYLPILILYIWGFFFLAVDVDIRMLNLSLSACIPPLMNPIVYTLKTKEIMNKIPALFRIVKVGSK